MIPALRIKMAGAVKAIRPLYAAFFFVLIQPCRPLYAYMSSNSYGITVGGQAASYSSACKVGGEMNRGEYKFRVLGGMGQPGLGPLLAPAVYDLRWTLNSVRPSRSDVYNSHAYPNPCDIDKGCSSVTFTLLTMNAVVKIYTVSGELVRTIKKSDATDSLEWDLRNEGGRKVAGGLYMYLNEGNGTRKSGKLLIIR